jgi:uncharacterized membrane protein
MQKLNTTAVYILSIVGFLCCCIGLGWIPALIGLLIANSGLKKYSLNPENYENGKAMKTARTVAIVALIISIVVFIGFVIFFLSFDGQCDFYEWTIDKMEENPDANQAQIDQMYQAMEEAGCR